MIKKFIIIGTQTWVTSCDIEVELESENIEELQEKILEGNYTIAKRDFIECLDSDDQIVFNEEGQKVFKFEDLLEE